MIFYKNTCPILSAVSFVLIISHAAAYDALDPNGNITMKWDVLSWTRDGYLAVVTMSNFQMYRDITSPGWTLGWVWAKKEVIRYMVGAEAVEQGDCSEFKRKIPHCCKKNPTVVDLLPGVPYTKQIADCCKGGVLASWGQDPSAAVSSFLLRVGRAGTFNTTVTLPKNFTLLGPGQGYTCSQAKIVPSTVYHSADGLRKTQALMTWNVTCSYSQLLASRYPTCACGCQDKEKYIQSELILQKDANTFTFQEGQAFAFNS